MLPENQGLTAEIEKTLSVLSERCSSPDSLEYFFELARTYFDVTKRPPEKEVLILGCCFPEEVLLAGSLRPHWVIGGSLSLGESIDERVPRDADAVSRSILGYLMNYGTGIPKKMPVLIPVVGDNFRKLAYLLSEEGYPVIPLDIAPSLESSRSVSSVAEQLDALMEDLSFSWKMPGAGKRLRQAADKVFQSRRSLNAILKDPALPLNGTLKLFLANTYFYADDPAEWARNLEALAADRKAHAPDSGKLQKAPGILIAGSPILFPNYKVPLLLESCGLRILGSCSSLFGKLLAIPQNLPAGPKKELLCELAKNTCTHDCSGAYVSNDPLRRQVENALQAMDVKGVIFHIIKGQIEYDFELEQLEPLFSKYQVPVFRLETDYHDNDVEQLRIRLEAFSELLLQDMIKHEKMDE